MGNLRAKSGEATTASKKQPEGRGHQEQSANVELPCNPLWRGMVIGNWRGVDGGADSPFARTELIQRMCAECSKEDGQPGAVQRRQDGNVRKANVQAIQGIASEGLSGANQPLPHHGRIQAAFGHHDVSSVRTTIGAAAGRASERMGALAYTSGDRIAFRQPPDLRLAAHEAAHTVQQRSGLKLPDNVGRPNDRWERHADRVADAVVAGESAEPLLNEVAPGAGHTAPARGDGISGAVQGKTSASRSPQRSTLIQFNGQALDPGNPYAWSFIGPHHRRTGYFRDAYLATLSEAAGSSMEAEREINESGEPSTDEERELFSARIRKLVKLNALGMMASHRATIEARQNEMIRSLEDRTEPENEFDRVVPGRAATISRIRETAAKVHQLQELKEELEGYRRDLSTVHARSLISSSSVGNINDMYNTIADSASSYNSVEIRNYLRRTARYVFGTRRSGDELRMFAWGISRYLKDWRQQQINGIKLSLSKMYEAYPFFSELDAEDFEQGEYDNDEALESAVRNAYQEIIEDIDDAIVDIGSEDIHPFDLPEAITSTKDSLPSGLHTEFDEVISDHEMTEFWWTLGLTFAQVALVFIPVVGPALAAGVGLLDLAMQTEEVLDQMTMSDAATNPEAELLGVGGPGTLDWAMLAVTAILTAADLGMVAREFRAARGAMALDALRLGEGQMDEITSLIDDLMLDPTDVGRLGTINDETLEMFQRRPELLSALSENPVAARLLKHCASPCWPENLEEWVIDYLDDLMSDLNARGLALEDIGTSPEALRGRLAAVEDDAGYTRIFNELEDGLDTAEHIAEETRRGRALYDESSLGSAIDEGLDETIGARMVTVEGAHDVGVSAGRSHAVGALGLQEANWVNPFEFRRSRFGQGFDDVLQDSSGNLWIVEYKGGTAGLSSGQMSPGWVRSRIARYRAQGGEVGREWARRLQDALDSGRLRGIALSTPIEGRTAGQTVELGRWIY